MSKSRRRKRIRKFNNIIFLIGASYYQDKAWGEIANRGKNLNAMKEHLVKIGFDEELITIIKNRTKEEILEQITAKLDTRKISNSLKEKSIFFYFSGHALAVLKGKASGGFLKYAFVPYDVKFYEQLANYYHEVDPKKCFEDNLDIYCKKEEECKRINNILISECKRINKNIGFPEYNIRTLGYKLINENLFILEDDIIDLIENYHPKHIIVVITFFSFLFFFLQK